MKQLELINFNDVDFYSHFTTYKVNLFYVVICVRI